MDKEQAIQEILQDLENQPVQERRTFRAYLNQPELININSINAIPQSAPITSQTNNSYYNFTVNLPRPALDVKSIQLLKSVIPQAQCSIPDYSLIFPYYRLRTVPIDNNGQIAFIDKPSFDSLFFVRLLPSYYKRELILNNNLWGYNKTFNDYEELSQELKKACTEDKLFTYGTHYFSDDVEITYNDTINRFQFTGQSSELEPVPPTYDQWVPDATYPINTIVFYEKIFYQALKEIPEASPPPPENPTNWEVAWVNSYTPWSVEITYNKDDVVFDEVDEYFYICIVDETSFEPPPNENPEQWLNVSQFFSEFPYFTSYLIAGYTDPNVDTLLQYVQDKSTTTYVNQNINNIGDFTFSSIPGNQYVSQQTLARRLGFTWDGTGMITDNINDYINTGILYGSTTALFYNRLRIVPPYIPQENVVNLLELSASNPITIHTYTADGYCNLVYSSVINIYTTIIGTSSVDTQRDANLLAMVPLDCNNLGISMNNNYIDTKLTKLQTEIYSIYIELRDENGQPYLLTNNAVVSLLLKLSYD